MPWQWMAIGGGFVVGLAAVLTVALAVASARIGQMREGGDTVSDGVIRVLSLGAGVQSTVVALMAERGDILPIDCAIFADTQSEPSGVYRHLDWLSGALSYPVHRVSRGSLRQEIFDASAGKRGA